MSHGLPPIPAVYIGGGSGSPGAGAVSRFLSGSDSGLPISIVEIASPGTLIHTASSVNVLWDEVFLWASNVHSAEAALTIEWGAAGQAGMLIRAVSFPANSAVLQVSFGFPMYMGLEVRAFSSVASAFNVFGYIARRRG